MVKIKNMKHEDFEFALRLTNLMSWDYARRDFEWMTHFEPAGCFVALDSYRRIGITTTITYENLGWIGNVIVSPEHRGRGIGSRLVEHAVDYLRNRSADFIGLYSYPETLQFYNNLGFREGESFLRLSIRGGCGFFEKSEKMRLEELKGVIELDSKCFGACRKKVLTKIFNEFKELCRVTLVDGKVVGYIMGTKSAAGIEVGPCICHPKYRENALNLLKATLSHVKAKKISMGVPMRKFKLVNKLKEWGFKIDFKVIRMFYKGQTPAMKSNFIFAMESLERG